MNTKRLFQLIYAEMLHHARFILPKILTTYLLRYWEVGNLAFKKSLTI